MKRSLPEIAIAVVVPLIIVGLILNDDYASKRHNINAGAQQINDALIKEDLGLRARDARLEATIFDSRGTTLKRLVSERRESEAENLAKAWMVAHYQERVASLERNRIPIDLYLGRLSREGKSEEFILAELERLLAKPMKAAEAELAEAQNVPPKKALPIMLAFYERLHRERMHRSTELQQAALR